MQKENLFVTALLSGGSCPCRQDKVTDSEFSKVFRKGFYFALSWLQTLLNLRPTSAPQMTKRRYKIFETSRNNSNNYTRFCIDLLIVSLSSETHSLVSNSVKSDFSIINICGMASNGVPRVEIQDGTCLVQILLSHAFLAMIILSREAKKYSSCFFPKTNGVRKPLPDVLHSFGKLLTLTLISSSLVLSSSQHELINLTRSLPRAILTFHHPGGQHFWQCYFRFWRKGWPGLSLFDEFEVQYHVIKKYCRARNFRQVRQEFTFVKRRSSLVARRSFGRRSVAYRLSSHSWIFLIPHL